MCKGEIVDLKKRNIERYAAAGERADFKDLVKYGHESDNTSNVGLGEIQRIDYGRSHPSEITILNLFLAKTDARIKQKGFDEAYTLLEEATRHIDKKNMYGRNLTDEQRVKFAQAIETRAYRLSNRLGRNPRLDEKVVSLVDNLERTYHVMPHSALEKAASSSLSIISVIIGLFLLSSNFLNYSVQLSPGTSSVFSWKLWLGIILLVVGIGSRIFYFKKKKEQENFISNIKIPAERKIKKRK